MICIVCGRKAESPFCFQHKPRKPLQATRGFKREFQEKDVSAIQEMQEFFMGVWIKRRHYCENCEKWLGNEPLSYMFDHTLEKSKYPHLKFEEDNIMILCLDCHDEKTRGFYSEIISNRIDYLKKKYSIFV